MNDESREKGNFERVGSSVGGMAGRAGDTAIDLMSSMIKTAANTFGGWWSRSTPDEAVRSFGDEQDRSCRVHFENMHRDRDAKASYDNVRPLYQFGHLAGSNPDYQGRSFEEVEGDLQKTWTPEHSTAFGDWSNVRDYINTGYSTHHSRGGNLP